MAALTSSWSVSIYNIFHRANGKNAAEKTEPCYQILNKIMTSDEKKSMFSHSCTFKLWLGLEQRSPVWAEAEPACDLLPATLSASQILGEVPLTCFATPDFPADFISESFPPKELHSLGTHMKKTLLAGHAPRELFLRIKASRLLWEIESCLATISNIGRNDHCVSR